MHDVTLVDHTSDQIDQQSDAENDAKDAARSQGAFFFRLCSTTASISRAHLEDVSAVVRGTKEGDGGFGREQWRGVADEGHEG